MEWLFLNAGSSYHCLLHKVEPLPPPAENGIKCNSASFYNSTGGLCKEGAEWCELSSNVSQCSVLTGTGVTFEKPGRHFEIYLVVPNTFRNRSCILNLCRCQRSAPHLNEYFIIHLCLLTHCLPLMQHGCALSSDLFKYFSEETWWRLIVVVFVLFFIKLRLFAFIF